MTNKERISNFIFAAFYIMLFALQVLPSLMAMIVGINAWFFASCLVGSIALIVQAIKFPCFATRLWNCGSVGVVIGTAIAVNCLQL